MSSRGTPWKRLRVLVTASLLFASVAACSAAQVPMPPNDATPEQVVRTYADAVHAGDCDTAEALVHDPDQSWCGNIDITALTVTDTTQERRQTEAGDGPMIERVWVALNIRHGDVSLPDGDHQWSYLLDRTGPGGAWRIYDQGMG